MEKHKEAARDEREAAERRVAARRAHEIAAIGAGDVLGLDKFAAEHSLATTDVRVLVCVCVRVYLCACLCVYSRCKMLSVNTCM